VDDPDAGVAQTLRLAKKALEGGARILAPETVEVEMPLHREIAAFEPREVSAALPARGAFDSFAHGERIDLAPAGDEVGERFQSIGLVVAALRKADGGREAQGLLVPPERSNALHLPEESLLVREVRGEAGRGGRGSRRREYVSIEKLFQDLERSMARPGRLGHDLHSATARFRNQCWASEMGGI
jgi:hypothetical protein